MTSSAALRTITTTTTITARRKCTINNRYNIRFGRRYQNRNMAIYAPESSSSFVPLKMSMVTEHYRHPTSTRAICNMSVVCKINSSSMLTTMTTTTTMKLNLKNNNRYSNDNEIDSNNKDTTSTVAVTANNRDKVNINQHPEQKQTNLEKLNKTNNTITKKKMKKKRVIAVIGGGASGIFASISASNAIAFLPNLDYDVTVIVLESSKNTLRKVKISGGGRCNVLHDTTITVPTLLNNGYPRGYKELKSIYHKQFTPTDMYLWFTSRGVTLKTEKDGRMFPITDTSQTIIDTLHNEMKKSNVIVQKECTVTSIESMSSTNNNNTNNNNNKSINNTYDDDISLSLLPKKFRIRYRSKGDNKIDSRNNNSNKNDEDITKNDNDEGIIDVDAIILATGSSPIGYQLAKSLGHTIIQPVPSLFTFNAANDCSKEMEGLLYGLAGVSVPHARIRFKYYVDNNNPNHPPPPPQHTIALSSAETIIPPKKRKMKTIEQEGPLLITHQGLSGPAVLRLSSFGAREIASSNYRGTLYIHWAPTLGTVEDVFALLWQITIAHPKRTVATRCPMMIDLASIPSVPGAKHGSDTSTSIKKLNDDYESNNDFDDDYGDSDSDGYSGKSSASSKKAAIPKRLWSKMVEKAGLDPNTAVWGQASKKCIRQLATLVTDCTIEMTGKSTNKDEFVTAGGLDCGKEIDMTTMQSKVVSCNDGNGDGGGVGGGFYVCGEIINIDGVTGGFNFMNCWSTGYVAGISAAQYVLSSTSMSLSKCSPFTTLLTNQKRQNL